MGLGLGVCLLLLSGLASQSSTLSTLPTPRPASDSQAKGKVWTLISLPDASELWPTSPDLNLVSGKNQKLVHTKVHTTN